MRILAVDGDSVFRRNWEATAGQDATGAINRSVGLVFRAGQFDRHIVAWDGGVDLARRERRPSFRKAREASYKAGRTPPGPGYYTARAKCQEAMPDVCIVGPEIEVDGYRGFAEADDVIAWIAKNYCAAADKDWLLRIMSTDGDLETLALDIPRIDILKFGVKPEDALWDTKRIEARRGVEPQDIPEMKALMGDKFEFDGIEGIGETTAAVLIRRFGTAAKSVEQGPDIDTNEETGIPAKNLNKTQRESLRNGGELVAKCLWLATLRPDLPLSADLLGFSPRIGGDDPHCVCRQPGAAPGPCDWCASNTLPDLAAIRERVSGDTWLGRTCLDLCDVIERLTKPC